MILQINQKVEKKIVLNIFQPPYIHCFGTFPSNYLISMFLLFE